MGEGRVISVRQGESRVVGEYTHGSRQVNEYTRQVGSRMLESVGNYEGETTVRRSQMRQLVEEEPTVVEKIVEKHVDYVVERKVPVERVVEKEYDVVIEKQVERVREIEVDVEKVVHREIEKTVEVPVERVVEVPVERVIERPVEVKKYVPRVVERVEESTVRELRENVIMHENIKEVPLSELHHYEGVEMLAPEVRRQERRVEVEVPVYHDNIIEQEVLRRVERVVEVPRERLVEKHVDRLIEKPVYRENIIEKVVHVPREVEVRQEVEHIVEVPVIRENIIRRPVRHDVTREVVEEVKVDHIVEEPVYVENIVERKVDNPIHKPVFVQKERIVEIPNFHDVRVGVARAQVTGSELSKDKVRVTKTEKEVPIHCEVWREKPVEVHVDKEVIVENIIEKPVLVEQIEEREVKVDRVIEEEYEVVVPRVKKVEVTKEIRVVKKITHQEPQYVDIKQQKAINVERNVDVAVEGREILESDRAVQDQDLQARTEENMGRIAHLEKEVAKLEILIQEKKAKGGQGKLDSLNKLVEANAHLKSHLNELKSRIDVNNQYNDKIREIKNYNDRAHTVEANVPSIQVQNQTQELKNAVQEN